MSCHSSPTKTLPDGSTQEEKGFITNYRFDKPNNEEFGHTTLSTGSITLVVNGAPIINSSDALVIVKQNSEIKGILDSEKKFYPRYK